MLTPRQIAEAMGPAEKSGDKDFFMRYLHNDLVFRRARGKIVNKATFLADLAPRKGRLDSEFVEDEAFGKPDEDSMVISAIVRTLGASFRNVRVFVRDGGEWQCRLWINTLLDMSPGMQVEIVHHVSLVVRDLSKSREFYEQTLCLSQSRVPRPDFSFDGAWYQVGAGQLHLIVRREGIDPKDSDRPPPTYRMGKDIDSRDVHFAVRVYSFSQALEYLKGKGYSENANSFLKIRINRPSTHSGAGFPQIYILDPDHHVIEINAQTEDG